MDSAGPLVALRVVSHTYFINMGGRMLKYDGWDKKNLQMAHWNNAVEIEKANTSR